MVMFQKGLKDVVAVQTSIASVEGDKGELRYRGVSVGNLIGSHSFEEVAYFIWHGVFPKADDLRLLNEKMIAGRELPLHVAKIIDALPADTPLMDAMRTGVSAYSHTVFKDEKIEDQAI